MFDLYLILIVSGVNSLYYGVIKIDLSNLGK